MSELVVGSIAGLAANSYEIDISSGSTLDLTNAKAGSIPKAALPVGSILQVVSAAKTDTFSTSSTTDVDVTGLSVTITPTSTASKILVLSQISSGNDEGDNIPFFSLYRDATPILLGDAAGSRNRTTVTATNSSDARMNTASITYLDSPASTSALTYKIRLRSNVAVTLYVNRSVTDSDSNVSARATSTITVMEVAG